MMIDTEDLSSTIQLLLSKAEEMGEKGLKVSFASLKDFEPNHSDRDYCKAADIFNDRKSKLKNCVIPLDKLVKGKSDKLISQMWALVCDYFMIREKQIKDECDNKVKEARDSRDVALEEVVKCCGSRRCLQMEYDCLSSKFSDATKTIEDLNATIAAREITIAKLKSEVETLSELKENLSDIVSMLKDKKESKKAVG